MHTKEENLLYRERNNLKQVYMIYIVNIGISNPIDISKLDLVYLKNNMLRWRGEQMAYFFPKENKYN